MVDLLDYDKMNKAALRNMTVMELIEKLSKREEVVREHFNKVVNNNDEYPGKEGELEGIAKDIANEEHPQKDSDLIEGQLEAGLQDMMDDLYMIRTQIRERLYALGQTLYTQDFKGERVEDVLKEAKEMEEDIEQLKTHGHDGEIETGSVTTGINEEDQ